MRATAEASRLATPAARGAALGGIRYDWSVTLLSAWFLGGLYLDGWAHNHLSELESFFTPWHAIFYSGFFAVAGFLVATTLTVRRRGLRWRWAVPDGYWLALLAVPLFLLGGLADMLWHILFGVEADVEALLSPTHLLLGVSMALILSGPLRAAWRRTPAAGALGWRDGLPALLSLTFLLAMMTFFTQFAHPQVDTRATADGSIHEVHHDLYVMRGGAPVDADHSQALGIASILLQTGLLMGLVLLAVRRWRLPTGSLTLIFTLSSLLISVMQDTQALVPAALVAGLIADALLWRLQPAADRPGALRRFAVAVPVAFYALYFLALLATEGVGWSVHLWAGATVMAGIVGLLLSYLVVPPAGENIPATAGNQRS